ncbi:MAG: AIPR family protein [Candidatus Binatia bacterium]
MDLVTRNLLDAFRQEHGFPEDVDQATLFEHFANFCVASKEYSDEFEVEDLHVAGGNDLQLDGFAIVVNGVLVNSTDEVDDLAQTNKYLDAEFVFVQAKSGADFSGADISNMFYGIRELFAESPKLPRNELLQAKERVARRLYSKSPLFRHGNPRLKMYYVTAGKWQDDQQLVARIANEVATLEELNIFKSPPLFEPVDARRLQQYFNRAQNALTKTITFGNRVTLPAMEGVREAYLGYLPAPEYVTMITDENGNLLRGLFYENVRDFQGNNPVNKEIEDTLRTVEKHAFVLLNNGVTIVSEDLGLTGDRFTLSGFQVVNGCQTSHVLFNNQDELTDTVLLPVKLVVAPAEDLKNQIIKATNRQTVVKTEELSALTDFQKLLELYYNAIPEQHRLYYERRSQQFRATPGLEKIRIVTISTQIRAFASMFLDRAHQASRYYGTLLKDIESRIFVDGHYPVAYYVSAYALFCIESLLRRKQLDNRYRPFKYHLLGILRMAVAGADMPSMTTNRFEKYCESLRDVLWADARCLEELRRACSVLDGLLAGNYDRDKAKDSTIQTQAKGRIQPEQATPADAQKDACG